ncbi:hypothetical protein OVZ97_15670, partial [Salmonella enterica subsp. enterica serovar 1,4,[5],12:i:-]|nr:hypothetical protein [Salmonella enterica subsp. enterica serovar 1,4,[5],12:i:-]
LVYCKMSVGSTHHLEMVFVWKQNYILVDEYFFFCCTWIVNSACKIRGFKRQLASSWLLITARRFGEILEKRKN